MKTIMPAHLALYLADAMLAAVSPDTMTPVITGIHLERDGKKLRATATDRYRVHEVTLADAKTTGDGGEHHIMPSGALRWLKRTMPIVAPRRADRASATVTLRTTGTGEDRSIVVNIETADGNAASYITKTITGNFPPLHRLFEIAEKAERWTGDVAYKPTFLGSLAALLPGRDYTQPRLKQTAAESTDGKPATKPGPILATAGDGDRITARALIQPNLILR